MLVLVIGSDVRSLLPLSTPLASSDGVEALLDVLTSPCGSALLALQQEKTCTGVPGHLRLDTLAVEAAHILLDVPLVETIDHRALVTTLQKNVVLAAKVTLHIHLSLEELKHVVLVTIELLAQGVEVGD